VWSAADCDGSGGDVGGAVVERCRRCGGGEVVWSAGTVMVVAVI